MNNSLKAAKILLSIKAVTLKLEPPYRYASGILSPVYTDCRILMSFPTERKTIRDLYIEAIKDAGEFDVIAGTATAGIPHSAWIAEKMGLPMSYIRGKTKDHGKGNQIEGRVQKGQKVAIVEDLISTGESSIQSAKALREAGAKITHVFAITTYGMEKSIQNLKDNKLKLSVLTTFTDTLKVAESLKMISQKELQIILKWVEDPAGWGKKMGYE